MVIVVPKVGEEAETIPAGATSKEASKEGKVNINTATVEELKTLKGVGEKKAEAIIEYRKKNGSLKYEGRFDESPRHWQEALRVF